MYYDKILPGLFSGQNFIFEVPYLTENFAELYTLEGECGILMRYTRVVEFKRCP